jgi:hypothetical protein
MQRPSNIDVMAGYEVACPSREIPDSRQSVSKSSGSEEPQRTHIVAKGIVVCLLHHSHKENARAECHLVLHPEVSLFVNILCIKT